MKKKEQKNEENCKEKILKENDNDLNEEKINEKFPLIYKKKKRTKVLFEGN